jgi:hypothetical protein
VFLDSRNRKRLFDRCGEVVVLILLWGCGFNHGVDFGVGGEGGFGLVHVGDVGTEDGEEAEGVLETVVEFAPEAVEGGLSGLKEEAAKAGVGGAADFVLALGEFAEKGGVASPMMEGPAADGEGCGDGADGVA